MKLLCINNKPIPGRKSKPENLALIKEGDEYEGGLSQGYSEGILYDCYIIHKLNKKYHIERFVPIDTDLDETTLVNEEWEEKYCVPVNK